MAFPDDLSKIYPKNQPGFFRKVRNFFSTILQLLLFVTPWFVWGDRQAILLNLQERKFHFFSLTFWPQETFFLWLTMVSLAITLFFVSSILGRMWCGYACPQTLLTQSFILVERIIEGDSFQRVRLDRKMWDTRKFAQKGLKFGIWFGMSLYLGFTFAGYFHPIRDLAREVLKGEVTGFPLFLIVFLTIVSYLFFGIIREKFCHTMCPYSRIQSVMLDNNSLAVAYDHKRGEPRGKIKDPNAADCIDCKACVHVCPAGIDIRDGIQFECIQCAACIDACDEIMTKVKRPKGLVRYASENIIEGNKQVYVRLRPVLYSIAIVVLSITFAYKMAHRKPYDLLISRLPSKSTQKATTDGKLSNFYQLKIINRQGGERTFKITLDGPEGSELIMPTNPVSIPGETLKSINTFILLPEGEVKGSITLKVTLEDINENSFKPTSRFVKFLKY